MTVAWRRQLDTVPTMRWADWPVDWPLPVAGDFVGLSADEGGYVSHIGYDLASGSVTIWLR